MKKLYPHDYRTRDPRAFLYLFTSIATPAHISDSFSNFLYASALEQMESLATHKNQIIIPIECLSGKRIVYLKDKNYFSFKVGPKSYLMLPESELEESEIKQLQQYIENLKWNFQYNPYRFRYRG
ncbi:hypothetical protein [Streptomyces sp. NPDC048275]|uniref:hypothetical protein n=1 Tax=Bacillati TaxID=1783272 RepID=UPI0034102758